MIVTTCDICRNYPGNENCKDSLHGVGSCHPACEKFEFKDINLKNDRYLVNESGIYERRQDENQEIRSVRICYTPITITATGHNIDTGENWLEIAFQDPRGRNIREWVTFKAAFTRAGILELMSKGVIVPEGQAKCLNDFLSYMVYLHSSALDETIITTKNGWKDNNSLFVLGNTGFTQEGSIRVLNTVDKTTCAGLVPTGNLDVWVGAMKPILEYPKVRFKFYTCLTAPLLRLLGLQSFVLDNYFDSTAAKTTTSDAAMSMIGNPVELQKSANTTKVGAERVAEQFTDLPVNLDETSSMKAEILEEMVYMWANEKGRLRGKKDGGLQDVSNWKTVVMTTGEKAITSDKSFTGAKIRVIELFGAIPDRIPRETGIVNSTIKTNYGHIFPLYIKRVFEHKDGLKEEYQQIRQKFIDGQNEFDARLCDTYATIALAGTILESVFKDVGIDPVDAIDLTKTLYTEITGRNKIERYSDLALDAVASWVASKEKYFIVEKLNEEDEVLGVADELGRYEIHGWIVRKEGGVEYIDIVPTLLRKFLEQSEIQAERCYNDWRDAGIIVTANGRFTTTQRHPEPVRVIRFKAEYLKPKVDTKTESVLKFLSETGDKYAEPANVEELKRLREILKGAILSNEEFEDVVNEAEFVDKYLFETRKFKVVV